MVVIVEIRLARAKPRKFLTSLRDKCRHPMGIKFLRYLAWLGEVSLGQRSVRCVFAIIGF